VPLPNRHLQSPTPTAEKSVVDSHANFLELTFDDSQARGPCMPHFLYGRNIRTTRSGRRRLTRSRISQKVADGPVRKGLPSFICAYNK